MAEQCTATAKSTGERCTRPVVPGATVCRFHGGAAKQVQAAAARRLERAEVDRQVAKLVGTRVVDPASALLELVHGTAAEVDYWRAEVAALGEDEVVGLGVTKTEVGQEKGQPTDVETREVAPHIAYRMFIEAQDRLAKYAALALKAGVEERRVRLAESQGALVAEAISRVLDRLDLSPSQRSLVGEVVPAELRALAARERES